MQLPAVVPLELMKHTMCAESCYPRLDSSDDYYLLLSEVSAKLGRRLHDRLRTSQLGLHRFYVQPAVKHPINEYIEKNEERESAAPSSLLR